MTRWLLAWLGIALAVQAQQPASGPLRLHPANPRYFADASGKAVYLTGSHTWNNFVDMGTNEPPATFDFEAHLKFLEQHHHNFTRLWRWELTSWDTRANAHSAQLVVAPHPWKRTGPGMALDGKPRFSLDEFNEDYFARLRARVQAAGARGIYVSVMLFEGWGLQHIQDAWNSHPFHRDNNVNRLNGDANGDGRGIEAHTLAASAVRAVQERYVRKVVDTLNDLDNVLYEIANESGAYSTQWQYHMIRLVKEYEQGKPKQHPVGMTFQYSSNAGHRGLNQALYESPADWISPNAEAGRFNYQTNPPPAKEGQVVLTDTDHLWRIGGDVAWVWKSFCRGLNPIFMDPYDNSVLGKGPLSQWEPLRRAMGRTRRLAQRIDLAGMTPRNELASTAYCLAQPGVAYVVYLPSGGEVTLSMATDRGEFETEWIDPVEERHVTEKPITAGAVRNFKSPLTGDAVLFLKATSR